MPPLSLMGQVVTLCPEGDAREINTRHDPLSGKEGATTGKNVIHFRASGEIHQSCVIWPGPEGAPV